MLEKLIEKKVCDHAKKLGMIVYKMNPLNNRGIPDRLFITKDGIVFFIEFKQLGKKPNDNQAREIERIRKNIINVFVIDTVEAGIETVNKYA